jgi:hypothetical protein
MFMCGEKYRRRYICGDKEPSSAALILGTSVHVVAANTLRAKLADTILKGDDVKDAAAQTVNETWEKNEMESGVYIDPEEGKTPAKAQGEVVDKAVGMCVCHAEEIAPAINPAKELPGGHPGIEWPWVLTMNDLPYKIAGRMDVVEESGVIRDLKTAGRRPQAGKVVNDQQLSMYTLAYNVICGKMPTAVALDTIVGLKSGPVYDMQVSDRSQEDINVILAKIGAAIRAIEAEVFLPANDEHWICCEKYCGFARDGSCPYFRKRVSVPQQKELF